MAKPGGPYLPSSRGKLMFSRIALLWVVLIVAFVAIWQLLNDDRGAAGHAAAHRTTSGPEFSVLTVLPIVLGALVFGYFLLLRRRALRFNAENMKALDLFAAADYATAAERFADLGRRYQRPAYLRVTAAYNEALAIARGGAIDEALARLSDLDRAITQTAPGLRPTVAAQLAVLYALRGEPAVSDRWIAEAEPRLKLTADPRVTRGILALARLINDIRRDEREAAVSALDENWSTLEGTMIASELRPFRALRAFAVAGGGIPAQNPQAPGACIGFADARPGELVWLGAAWPEMQEFLGPAGQRA